MKIPRGNMDQSRLQEVDDNKSKRRIFLFSAAIDIKEEKE
jgi:hypothetical protein